MKPRMTFPILEISISAPLIWKRKIRKQINKQQVITAVIKIKSLRNTVSGITKEKKNISPFSQALPFLPKTNLLYSHTATWITARINRKNIFSELYIIKLSRIGAAIKPVINLLKCWLLKCRFMPGQPFAVDRWSSRTFFPYSDNWRWLRVDLSAQNPATKRR